MIVSVRLALPALAVLLALATPATGQDATAEEHLARSAAAAESGDLLESLAAAEAALQRADALADVGLARRCLLAAATAHAALGDPDRALGTAHLATTLPVAALDPAVTRLALLTARTLADVGRDAAAEQAFEIARQRATSAPVRAAAPELEVEVLLAAAANLARVGRDDAALAYVERAGRLAPEDLAVDLALARLATRRGDDETARRQLADLATRAALADAREIAALAALLLVESDLERPELPADIDARLADAQPLADHPELAWRLPAARGRLAARREASSDALTHLEDAVALLEVRRLLHAVPGALTVELQGFDPYREAAVVAARLGRPLDALRFAELVYRRDRDERLARQDGPLTPEPLAPDFLELLRETRALDHALHGLPPGAERRSLAERRDGNLHRLAFLRDGGRPPLPDLADLQQRLADDGLDAALAFLVNDAETLRFVVADGSVEVDVLPFGTGAIADALRAWTAGHDALRSARLDLLNLGLDLPAGRLLYDALLAPVADRLGSGFVVVPDGVLWSLPFASLPIGGEAGPVLPARPFEHLADVRYVVHEATVAVAPSLAGAAAPRSAAHGSGLLAVAGGPRTSSPGTRDGLPGVLAEVHRTGALGVPELLVLQVPGDLAERAPGSRWLHVAGHAVVDGRRPHRSRLVFGPSIEDGKPRDVGAWELAAMDLSSVELVTLTGSAPAEGEQLPGAGVATLAEGLLRAGAGAVLLGVWPAEDQATLALETELYRGLGEGLTPAKALRRAQLAVLDSRDARGFARLHPWLWGSWFVVQDG